MWERRHCHSLEALDLGTEATGTGKFEGDERIERGNRVVEGMMR